MPAMGYREELEEVPAFRGAPVHKYKGQFSITVITVKLTLSIYCGKCYWVGTGEGAEEVREGLN